MKLSYEMRYCLSLMSDGLVYEPSTIGCSIHTFRALERRGLVSFVGRTGQRFMLTPAGSTHAEKAYRERTAGT